VTAPFPNSPVPAHYRRAIWNTALLKRNGVHYVGDTVTITLQSALSDTVTYTIRNYFGEILSTGSVSSGSTSFTPTVPSGGWQPGWYRVYLTGPNSDATFFNSYGATNFCVVRNDSHFVPMPPGNTVGTHLSEAPDMVAKGVMGIGTSRLQIQDAANYTTGQNNLANCELDLALTNTYWVDPGVPYEDAARPRYAWCQFPNGSTDQVEITAPASQIFGWMFCATAVLNGNQVFVEVTSGTNPNTIKIIVSYPDAVTVVETFDNLSDTSSLAASITVNASSQYIRFFGYNGTPAQVVAQTAIGSAKWDGVVAVVADLYALGCTYFEGPQNEPPATGIGPGMTAHMMMLFQAAVHTGNASAKAIGPCYVSINWAGTQGWYDFFSHGGADYCDEISLHAYNSQTNGDINLGRNSWDAFFGLMRSFGVSKTLWQTESTSADTPVYGIYHPRRARVPILQTLLCEQYGVTKERNNYWYDISHGFWGVPAWFENGDESLEPHALLYRVLAEETWGKPYVGALDFGTPGNNIFLGNIYTGAAGTTVALMATSYIEDAAITLQVSGTPTVTVVDGFGVSSSVALSQGRVTVQLTDVPAYVELPVGAQAGVYQINDWPPLQGLSGGGFSSAGTTKEIDGVSYPVIADGAFMSNYASGTGIAPTTYATPPSVARVLFATSRMVERVIVWCGPAWQQSGTLITFDVQTTTDGTNWTTRRTISKPPLSYFEFGTSSTNAGCFLETYWDEQWVFDVKLSTPVACTGVRLNVTEASYGGEPLSDTTYGTAFGQGNSVQGYRLEEIGIYGFVSSASSKPGRRRGKGSAW
jgi:hypothetical protein